MRQRAPNLSGPCALLLAAAATCGAQEPREFQLDCAGPGGLSGSPGEEFRCINATLSDGTTTITAGSATSRNLDFAQNAWRLSGDVRLVSGERELRADDASFVFSDGEIVSFELNGSPTRMSDVTAEEAILVSGEAQQIVYDQESGVLQLIGDVRFAFGDDVFDTCALSYNLREGSFGTGDCGARATAILRPSDADQDNAAGQRDGP